MVDQSFLQSAADLIKMATKIRGEAFGDIGDGIGEDEDIYTQTCALVVIAADDVIEEFWLQIDRSLDGLGKPTEKIFQLLDRIVAAYSLSRRIYDSANGPQLTEEEEFDQLIDEHIKFLEILAMSPDWPDRDVVLEKARIGRRALEELRMDSAFDEETLEEVFEYVLHIGTMLVRMVLAEGTRLQPETPGVMGSPHPSTK